MAPRALWLQIHDQTERVLDALDAGDMPALRRARLARAALLDEVAGADSDYADWAASLARMDREYAPSGGDHDD